jgi:hypothetical protein
MAAPNTILKFAGQQIGDGCHGLTCEVVRARGVNLQSGLQQVEALLSDRSPNLYFRMRVFVHHKGTSQVQVAKWVTVTGQLMSKGLQTVEVIDSSGSGSDETLTMDDAAMVGPIVSEYRDGENGRLIRGMAFEFWSTKAPY